MRNKFPFLLIFIFLLPCAANSLPSGSPDVSIGPIVHPKGTVHYTENEYGNDQVERMLAARPAMRKYSQGKMPAEVGYQDTLWIWAAKQFEQRSYGKKIYWDAHIPRDCEIPENNPSRGYIRIPSKVRCGSQRGRSVGFQTLWSDAIFEFCEISRGLDLAKIERRARKGKINRKNYLRSIGRIEYSCWKNKCVTFDQVFKPWAKEHEFKISPKLWNCPVKISVTKALSITNHSFNRWQRRFEKIYDFDIAPKLKRRGIQVRQ